MIKVGDNNLRGRLMKEITAATVATRKAITYVVVGLSLTFSYFVLRESTWQGSAQLHTLMEVVATVLAMIVGAMALVRYYSKKEGIFLFIGAGFLGTAFLDGYHAVVTSEAFQPLMPSELPSLIPWSWIASRFFLSVIMCLSLLAWMRQQRLGETGLIKEKTVYLFIASFTLASFLFFISMPLPRAYYPEFIFHRPEEFIPALFFLMALVGYLRKGDWRENSFEHWLVLALIVSFVSQAAFMSFSGQLFDLEFDAAHILKKGSYICVLTGLLISMYEIFRVEEKGKKNLLAALAALRESEEKYQSIIATAVDGYWMIDGNSITLDVNESLCSLLGYKKNEMLGRSAGDFVDDKNRLIFAAQHKNKSENKYRKYEVALTAKDGRKIPTTFSATTMPAPKGKKPWSFAFVTDISDIKRAERKLAKHRDHLEEQVAERTAEVQEKAARLEEALESERKFSSMQQEFVSLVSHEFRTPLAIIDGAAQRIARRLNKITPEELKTRTSKIRGGVGRMTDLIDKTLYLSRLDSGKIKFAPEKINLKELIREGCEHQSEFSPDHDIRLDIESLPDRFVADPALMDQVFCNLLSNAIKYCPGGCRIDVIGQQENDQILIAVRDQGIGISKDELPRMFERFFRTEATIGIPGTGIGLNLCKEFVEMHGGTIEVDSVEGEGSNFTVRLPIGGRDQ